MRTSDDGVDLSGLMSTAVAGGAGAGTGASQGPAPMPMSMVGVPTGSVVLIALLMFAVGGAAGVAAACLLAGRRGALTFWRVGEGRGGAGAGAGGGLGMMSFGQGKGVGGDVEAWPLCQQNGCSGYPPNRL